MVHLVLSQEVLKTVLEDVEILSESKITEFLLLCNNICITYDVNSKVIKSMSLTGFA